MKREEARQGPSDAELLSLRLSAAAALPDPSAPPFRHEFPRELLRAYESGTFTRQETWERLTDLWSVAEVVDFIAGRAA
jgi:hypothetical protein